MSQPEFRIEWWPIDRPKPYLSNARRWGSKAVEKVAASIKAFGWRQPIVCDTEDVICIGHLRLDSAKYIKLAHVPVHVASDLSPEQIRALRLADNRTHEEAEWDEGLLWPEFDALLKVGYDVELTGFDWPEIRALSPGMNVGETDPDEAPPLPVAPVAIAGDVWRLGAHRLICGDACDQGVVRTLLGRRLHDGSPGEGEALFERPALMTTDPPYGIELDSEWRDRAGLNGCGPAEPSYMRGSARQKRPGQKRTAGHTETSISGDTKVDWSDAFALVPSLQVAYVWHASVHTVAVVAGLDRLGFLYPQQIIWNKGRTVLTRSLYWFQHEPCWFVRKKNAPWYGKAGENSTVWDSPSPKFIMGSSQEEKWDHPTQKPVLLFTRPILNHTKPGELVYEPFCGSGTALIACEMTGRACRAVEIDPKYVDVIITRWEKFTGQHATLESENGAKFEHVRRGRRQAAEDQLKEEAFVAQT